MRRPLIAVSTGFADDGDYLGFALSRPLERLGALPVAVPLLDDLTLPGELLDRVDGVVLGFGRDIAPEHGGTAHATSTAHSPRRDRVELALAAGALERGVPVLGVCRGMQVINAALGGTLHGDRTTFPARARGHPGGDWARWREVVRAAVEGTPRPADPTHPITTLPGSRLAAALGPRIDVNSYHHQALDRLGSGVQAAAWADDGIVEAIEVPGAPALCLGVQWELQESWPGDQRFLDVFGLVIDAARRRWASGAGSAPPQPAADSTPRSRTRSAASVL